jgi:hypothetical protein
MKFKIRCFDIYFLFNSFINFFKLIIFKEFFKITFLSKEIFIFKDIIIIKLL